ncbi:hypothetical protein BD311DRAFT_624304, partial [Dichomitus squalens]
IKGSLDEANEENMQKSIDATNKFKFVEEVTRMKGVRAMVTGVRHPSFRLASQISSFDYTICMWDGSVEAHNNYKFFLDYDRRCDLPVNLPHGHSL